jgi:hypothetical protein
MPDLRTVDTSRELTRRIPDWGGARVAEGHTVETGYVAIQAVVMHAPPGHQLHPADVERAYCRQLELGTDQAWPPPTGYWREDGRFVLTDGRNRYVAALMLGLEYLFVAWLVPPSRSCPRWRGTG